MCLIAESPVNPSGRDQDLVPLTHIAHASGSHELDSADLNPLGTEFSATDVFEFVPVTLDFTRIRNGLLPHQGADIVLFHIAIMQSVG